ncbi:uncharacterized protein ColSpa_11870 [Colletotrichum spaethianum]|uniref:Uncharacterized protein n=1 Tax=Colletotrichum spaethianum TaxID=700344 RepID=A0AA37UKR3_9PEZI|nr:uncharacterized protein ColSpa_11870 [Colletotrichum spaethianum]GKT51689.1 hypothetical protein ColSpa_11870 [Colletotrichum spaethianum]
MAADSAPTESSAVQHESIPRAAYPIAAHHLLEMTTSIRGLDLLRCDLAFGSLCHSMGLTEGITREHPHLSDLRFGFGVYQPDEVLLASSFVLRHQSWRRLLVSTALVANWAGEHDYDAVDPHEGLERAADVLKGLSP